MPLTTAQNVGNSASRCLRLACEEVRHRWSRHEQLQREQQAVAMQHRLWAAIQGVELAPARVAAKR